MPAGTTFVSATQSSGPAFTLTTPGVGGTGFINGSLATMQPNTTATFTIKVFALASDLNGSTIPNTANVSNAITDPNPNNNSSQFNTMVTTSADLSVTKMVITTVVAGTDNTYTVTVTNNGTSDAQNVVLTDAVPVGATSDGATFPFVFQNFGPIATITGPAFGTTGTFNFTIPTLAAGVRDPPNVTVNANPSDTSGSVITNTATVSNWPRPISSPPTTRRRSLPRFRPGPMCR